MKEVIENNFRHRAIKPSTVPICSDCGSQCAIIPDHQLKREVIKSYAAVLTKPEYRNHVFAYCSKFDVSGFHLSFFANKVNKIKVLIIINI